MIDILSAAELALAEIRAHQLRADTFDVRQPQQGDLKYDRGTGERSRPCLPEIKLTVGDAAAFLAWCEYLQATEVRVWRAAFNVYFHLDNDRADLCWKVSTCVKRLPSGPHLPGIKPQWKRTGSNRPGKDAWISLEELRITLAALTAQVAA